MLPCFNISPPDFKVKPVVEKIFIFIECFLCAVSEPLVALTDRILYFGSSLTVILDAVNAKFIIFAVKQCAVVIIGCVLSLFKQLLVGVLGVLRQIRTVACTYFAVDSRFCGFFSLFGLGFLGLLDLGLLHCFDLGFFRLGLLHCFNLGFFRLGLFGQCDNVLPGQVLFGFKLGRIGCL